MMKTMSSVESNIVNFLAIISCIGIVVMIPTTYITIPDSSVTPTIDAYVPWLIANGIWGGAAYMVAGVMAALSPPANKGLYHGAHAMAYVAWVVINGTAAYVGYQIVKSGQQFHTLADIPGSMHLLIAVWFFSWVDVLWFQRHKRKELMKVEGEETASAGTGAPSHIGPMRAPNLLEQLSVFGRIAPGVRLGPLTKVYIEVDAVGNVWWDVEDFPTLTFTPQPVGPAMAAA